MQTMPTIIKLHTGDREVYVNVNNIQTMEEREEITVLFMGGMLRVNVNEKISEILKITEAEHRMRQRRE